MPHDLVMDFVSAVERRLDHEPVAYITNEKSFYGLKLHVDARVLDPRADTETLIDWALEIHAQRPPSDAMQPMKMLDLGCGSGAIALALKSQIPNALVWASDQNPQALALAQTNALQLRLDIHFSMGSWLTPFGDQRFDLIVSNPPYLAPEDPHLGKLKHEPSSALVSAEDGLADLKSIISQSLAHLHPMGWLLLEHGHTQAPEVTQFLQMHGFENIQTRLDLAGLPRCSGGQLKT
jgi:release factor glutamine methyltransferase